MPKPKKTIQTSKFHFENGLLQELRKKAAPKRTDIFKESSKVTTASKKRVSVFEKLPESVARRIIEE